VRAAERGRGHLTYREGGTHTFFRAWHLEYSVLFRLVQCRFMIMVEGLRACVHVETEQWGQVREAKRTIQNRNSSRMQNGDDIQCRNRYKTLAT
jgi:hypothetical protein